jgi:hypothetical protein
MAQLFKRMFGVAPDPASPTATLAKMRENMDLMEKRGVYLSKRAETCTERARTAVRVGDKRAALRELKVRKQYTTQLEQLENLKMNLFVQMSSLERALFDREQLSVMEQGVRALKSAQGTWTLNKIEKLSDDVQESLHVSTEIQDVLSRPLVEYDTDELDQELDEMLADVKPPADAAGSALLNAPSPPTTIPVLTDLEEIEELRASMLVS